MTEVEIKSSEQRRRQGSQRFAGLPATLNCYIAGFDGCFTGWGLNCLTHTAFSDSYETEAIKIKRLLIRTLEIMVSARKG